MATATAEPRVPSANGTTRWARIAGVTAALIVFAAALLALRHELTYYSFRQIRAGVRDIPFYDLGQAIAFTLCGYLALTLYDALALQYVKRVLPPLRVAFVGFVSYALTNVLGFPLLVGGSLRYRFYNAWGLSAAEIAMIVACNGITFWIGVLGVTGMVFVTDPESTPELLHLPFTSVHALGMLLLLGVAAYLWAAAFIRRPLRLGEWEFSLPTPGIALSQLAVSTADWLFAAAALWSLLPQNTQGLTFFPFLGAFLLAQIAGLLSHVPGGLGVFDAILVLLLHDYVAPTTLVAVLVAFRTVYYLLPLAAALVLLAAHEIARGRTGLARAARAAGAWVPGVAPMVLSLTTFIGGALMLFSGATPAVGARLRLLSHFVPLAVIESSHFIGSLTGAGLLVLARGLGRRLDAAYYLTVAALGVGIVSSLLKGLDYEEAIALAIVLAALIPARRHFYRRTPFTTQLFSPAWMSMSIVVLGASVWLGFFAYKHVDYNNDLWWRFAVRGDAPRFLRATVGAAVVILFVAVQRLLRPAAAKPSMPDAPTLARVRTILDTSPDTLGHLALLGDKSMLFSDSGNAFVMYGVEGRSFVAMGDPVGSPAERQELAWRFRELADQHGAWPVFYQVRMHNLPLYLDLGLALLKLGEEARVPLADFSLDGGTRKGLRRVVKSVEKDGCSLSFVADADVPGILPQLKTISDDWISAKRTREKGFSLGFWNEDYLRTTPIAVVRCGGRIIAFANLWLGGGKDELSVDLMRYTTGSPDGVMEYLLIELMLWGREQGYGAFNLGMAPLAGLENRQLAPIWNRIGALLFKNAESFYNFQGLRAYKQKFDPVWEPRYLASPGGLALPRILTNVTALVSRGLKGVIAR